MGKISHRVVLPDKFEPKSSLEEQSQSVFWAVISSKSLHKLRSKPLLSLASTPSWKVSSPSRNPTLLQLTAKKVPAQKHRRGSHDLFNDGLQHKLKWLPGNGSSECIYYATPFISLYHRNILQSSYSKVSCLLESLPVTARVVALTFTLMVFHCLAFHTIY